MNKVKGVHLSKKKFKVINELLDLKSKELDLIEKCDDEISLVCEELRQSALTIKLITHLSVCLNDDLSKDEKLGYLNYVLAEKDELIDKQKELWLKRNKSGGLNRSIKHLTDFFKLVEETKLFIQNYF